MAQQELWCKQGKHFWTREATRGRKPIACPEHQPSKVVTYTQHADAIQAVQPKKGDAQYAVITLPPNAKLEDGREVTLSNGDAFHTGDQGMAEYTGEGWTYTLFEAALTVTPAEPENGWTPEHRQSASDSDARMAKKLGMATQPLFCKAGKHEWIRPAQRGRKPESCPEHTPQREVKRLSSEEKVARMHQGKAEKAAERLQAEQETLRTEYATIDDLIERADSDYDAALARALKAQGDEFEVAWHAADVKQNSLIQVLNRKRVLAASLGVDRVA